jgi:hypothetical protein
MLRSLRVPVNQPKQAGSGTIPGGLRFPKLLTHVSRADEEVVLSVRTVERRIANIYLKLAQAGRAH